jgi:hypothetical protein
MKWFIHAGPFRFSILNLLSFFVTLCFILAWFSRLGDYDLETFFNTDSLYLPSVYKDLFTDGHALKGWVFNPAPNFFPDMLLYFFLMLICGNSFIIASFVFSVIQVLVLLYVMLRLFKSLMPGHPEHWHSLIFLLLTFFIMEYLFFTREYYYSFYILSNAFHTGSFVMGMLCLWMSLRYFTKPSAWLLVCLFMIGVLCVISDRLFLLFYTIPAFSTTLFFVRRFKRKHVLFFTGTLLLSAALGLMSLHVLSQGDYFYIDKPHKLMAFGDMQESFRIYSGQIGGYLSEFGFKSITICLSMAAFTGMIFLFFRARKSGYWLLCYYIAFSTVFSILVIGSPIINGNYTGYDTLRYNIYPFYLMPLNLTILLAYTLKHKTILRYAKPFGLVVYLLFFISACRMVDGNFLYKYFSYYPDKARLLDTLKERLDLKCGLAGYWDAKPMTMFSKKEVRLYAAFPDLNYQSHVANTQWYSTSTFNYLLMPDPVDTALYRQKLRSVQVLKTGLGFSIVTTPDFTFPDSGISPVLLDSLKAN